MYIPMQSAPIGRASKALRRGVVPLDCSDGKLKITCPDGTETTFDGAASCCYDGWDCNPCKGDGHYDDFAGDHLDCCGDGNSNDCYIQQKC